MARQTVKQMLIDLYKEERERERCALVHELKNEAEKIARPFIGRIGILRKKLSDLDNQMHELRMEVRDEEEKRDEELRRIKLFSFTHKTCGDALHKHLCDFDKETNDHTREILEGDKKGKKDE